VALLVVLVAVLVVYKADHALRAALPPLGPLPIQIAWFGAVGGVVAGLGGVFFYNAAFDRSYDYWHYSRPFVAGVVGGIGCLLFYVAILVGSKNGVKPDVTTFDALAFIFGFADESFRQLVAKLTRVLIGPGDTGP
jgi:H+/Cl- antiporter ClcA